MIQKIFKTRFSNEGSGKNDFLRLQNNDPATDDYSKDYLFDDCISHFGKRTPDRASERAQNGTTRARRDDDMYFITRRTPKYQYKTSNRTSYYDKRNRTRSYVVGGDMV